MAPPEILPQITHGERYLIVIRIQLSVLADKVGFRALQPKTTRFALKPTIWYLRTDSNTAVHFF